jgi:CHAD domain-containing protein
MSFELSKRKHIEDELRKLARDQLLKATRALRTNDTRRFRSAVHESRKRLKKVRAAVALLEQAGADVPRKDRKRFKKAAGALSRIRDSAAIIDTFDRLRKRYPRQLPEHTYGVLRRALVNARDIQEGDAQREGAAADVAARLKHARASAKTWSPPSIAFEDLVAIAADAYRRNRSAMRYARVTGQSAAVHRWRKELKTLWYFLRLAKPLTTGVAPLVADIRRLESELGDDHNLVILEAMLRSCRDLQTLRDDVRHVGRLALRMRGMLRRRAFALGRRIFARKPKAFYGFLSASARNARASVDRGSTSMAVRR